MNVVQLLKRAVAELKTDGWIQGDLHDSTGKHCAIGAVEDVLRAEFGGPALTGNFEEDASLYSDGLWFDRSNLEAASLYERAVEALDQVANKEGYDNIADLNDDEGQSFAGVRRAFDRAVLIAKQGGPQEANL